MELNPWYPFSKDQIACTNLLCSVLVLNGSVSPIKLLFFLPEMGREKDQNRHWDKQRKNFERVCHLSNSSPPEVKGCLLLFCICLHNEKTSFVSFFPFEAWEVRWDYGNASKSLQNKSVFKRTVKRRHLWFHCNHANVPISSFWEERKGFLGG